MKKKTNAPEAIAHKDVTPELLKKAQVVVAEHGRHTYSVSRIYAAHNAIFGLKEQPQTCSSCLTTRATRLAGWLADYEKAAKKDEQLAKPATIVREAIPTEPSIAAPDTTEVPTTGDKQDDPNEGDKLTNMIREALTEVHGRLVTGELSNADARVELEILREDASEDGVVLIDEALASIPTEDTEDLTGEDTTPQYFDPSAPNYVAPADGVVRIPLALKEGEAFTMPVDFTPNEGEENAQAKSGAKGLVKYADGSNVKAGKYAMADGRELAVAIGGKASIKEEDLT